MTPADKISTAAAKLDYLIEEYELPKEFESELKKVKSLMRSACKSLGDELEAMGVALKKRGASIAGLQRKTLNQKHMITELEQKVVRGLEDRLGELEAENALLRSTHDR